MKILMIETILKIVSIPLYLGAKLLDFVRGAMQF